MGETSAYIILVRKHLGDIGCDDGGWPELRIISNGRL
jgi:hypothetical protein